MKNPKIYLNSRDNIEKIELPDGTVTQRVYGNLPDFMVLAPFKEQLYELYDSKGNQLKLCRIVSVTAFAVEYEIINNFEDEVV